jgi:hypothetical protein
VISSDLGLSQLANNVLLFTESAFRALVNFLAATFYSPTMCITDGANDILYAVYAPAGGVLAQLDCCIQFKEVFVAAFLKHVFTGEFPLDVAEKIAISHLIHPHKRAWADVFQGYCLNEYGCLTWPVVLLDVDHGFDELGLVAEISMYSSDSQGSEFASASSNVSRARGRPRKKNTPLVESSVRRAPPRPCTRQNKNGYKEQALPDAPPRRKTVARKANPPEILQISEMQRLGVEKCQIDPEELTVERLLQSRPE